VTVLSTESTGGGLPRFGVFSHEQVYTVYLDMRRSPSDRTPSWTLEFAVLPGPSAAPSAAASRQGLVLPFPAVKEPPAWPADVVRSYLRKLVVVYGQITAEGKLDQLSVKDSPDARLNQPALDALQRWIFRPAQLNGAPVAVKVLLGIPLALSE
jgi:TonB family protein